MRTLLAALFCGLIITANAQTTEHPVQKIGYAESDYILSQLPEFKKIDSNHISYTKEKINTGWKKFFAYSLKHKIKL